MENGMKENYYDYPIPNGVVVFWIFTTPPIIFFVLLFIAKSGDIMSQTLSTEDTSSFLGFILMILLAAICASCVTNIFPAVKLRSNGVEIRFYFPLLTRWIWLPWNSITNLKSYSSPSDFLFKNKQKNLLVSSKNLPMFYHIPSIIYGHSFDRSFIIGSWIRGYDKIVSELDSRGTRLG
jgi:hypothetical protein